MGVFFGIDWHNLLIGARSEMSPITLIYGDERKWRNFRKTSDYRFNPY